MPRFSIIVPTYNEEKFLPYTLESIKRQNTNDYEIIVADANSKDKTRDIAKKNGAIVVQGGSPSKGRNNGAKKARGEILIFLDSDTILIHKNFLENIYHEFKSKKIDFATCNIEPISHKTIDFLLYEITNLYYFSTQWFSPHAAGLAIFCTKKAFNQLNGFDEDLKVGEDIDFVRRAKEKGLKFKLLNEKVATFSRRLDKEGRWKLIGKYLKYEYWTSLQRIIRRKINKNKNNNLINYSFSGYDKYDPKETLKAYIKLKNRYYIWTGQHIFNKKHILLNTYEKEMKRYNRKRRAKMKASLNKIKAIFKKSKIRKTK